jgi:PAS domain S-box-containing protein
MKKSEDAAVSINISDLRKRAEEVLRYDPERIQQIPAEDIQRLVQELGVHQIELELQNEELRRARTEIDDLLNKYFDLYELAPVGYFTFNERGLILEANLTGANMLGVQMPTLVKRGFSSFIVPDFQDAFYFHRKKVLESQSKQTCELKLKRKDGAQFYAQLETMLVEDGAGNFNQLRTAIIDITERKLAEEARWESEERYRTVLEANPDPVVVCDMEGKLIYLNPAFTDTFGWTIEERLGKKMDVFVPEENWPETKMIIDRALAGKGFSGFETWRYTKEGNTIPVSISAAIYWDRDGNPAGSVVSIRDISEQKQLEAQLQHAQKLKAVGTLAGGIAHEFNNLLQAVQGYAELLLLRRKKEEPTYRELDEIVRAAKRGGELSQQLLTFSRKVESKLRPVDLNFEVDRAIKLLSRTVPRMIEIEFHSEKELKPVNADPAQIEQILVNLALNAKDAMPDGGKLTIGTENVIFNEEYCRRQAGAESGEYVLLMVADTGHGMDKETRERIFEPFFTTKGLGEGTGIGLAIIYGIVKNHGGRITCSSVPGAGTTFKIYLPAMEHEAPSAKEEEPASLEGGAETILLVDDEESILDLGKEVLCRFGYTLLTAPDGKTALEFYRNEHGQIDLVILDMIMPGMSGRQCLEGLLKINPKAKVVISSGYSHIGHRKETMKAGARSFISKPYEIKQMLQVVREALDQD